MPKVSMGYAKKIKKNKKEHSQAKKTDDPLHILQNHQPTE